jgi:Holliday junction resolvase RusA-like endonuclease
MQFEFLIPEVHGKLRPRFSLRTHSSYTDPKTRKYEHEIRMRCTQAMKEAGIMHPTDKPCRVQISAFYKVPKSGTKADREAKRQNLIVPGRPDIDNIAKAVFDGMNGVAYLDDQQIQSAQISKQYSESVYGVLVSVYWNEDSEN